MPEFMSDCYVLFDWDSYFAAYMFTAAGWQQNGMGYLSGEA